MAMQLSEEEPEAGPWRVAPLTEVIGALTGLGADGRPAGHAAGHAAGRPAVAAGRPVVLAVDGRSSSGKTTLAARICAAVAGSAVVHTDDIAWQHSRFGWADLLVDGILAPVRDDGAVSFRPPAWAADGRPGSVDVLADCPLLIIEGVGAGRSETSGLIDALIWVQSDEREGERRSRARLGKPGEAPTLGHYREWMAEEMPFTAAQRTWERADLVLCGTPQISCDPVTEVVVAPSPAAAAARRQPC